MGVVSSQAGLDDGRTAGMCGNCVVDVVALSDTEVRGMKLSCRRLPVTWVWLRDNVRIAV